MTQHKLQLQIDDLEQRTCKLEALLGRGYRAIPCKICGANASAWDNLGGRLLYYCQEHVPDRRV